MEGANANGEETLQIAPESIADAVAADSEAPSEGLDGTWLHEGQANKIEGKFVCFHSSESFPLARTGETTCHMVLEGNDYYGRLSPCRQKLMWSDGDVWYRKPSEKARSGTPSRQTSPTSGSKHLESSAEKVANSD